MVKNALAGGASSHTPLGELTSLPRPLSWINGNGKGMDKGIKDEKGRQRRGGEIGKGKEEMRRAHSFSC